jgi:hypothetical protein
MRDPLLFVLPAGRSAGVDRPVAQSISDRLGDQGLEPGSATAATRIAEGLQRNVLDAAGVHPRTWADLLQASDLSAMGSAERRHLLSACDDLITDLTAQDEQAVERALLVDVRDLRDTSSRNRISRRSAARSTRQRSQARCCVQRRSRLPTGFEPCGRAGSRPAPGRA